MWEEPGLVGEVRVWGAEEREELVVEVTVVPGVDTTAAAAVATAAELRVALMADITGTDCSTRRPCLPVHTHSTRQNRSPRPECSSCKTRDRSRSSSP